MDTVAIELTPEALTWAEQSLEAMSVDEKIGQLFMMSVWSEWSDAKLQTVYDEAKKSHVGGVCFFAGTAARQVEITNTLNADSKIPMLVGIDGEWGVGMRVTDAHSFPFAMNVGAVQDTALVYEMGKQIGEQCALMGVHVNFAPVHDLNSNPLNPVINFRSYGSGVDNVSEKVRNYVGGMQSQGVLAVAKHFPGHGDTQTDSHYALPVINKSRAEFERQEFVPFRRAMDNGLQAVMMGHLNIPALDNVPASLSPVIINDILKKDLGFDGLVISDALNMNAVAKGYKNHYLKAFMAGNDILLFPASLTEGVNQLKLGLKLDVITEQDLDARCLRVLKYKYALGVHQSSPLDIADVMADLNPAKSDVLNHQLLSQSITLVRNVDGAVPVKADADKRIAAISINNTGRAFVEQLQSYAKVTAFNETVANTSDISRLLPKLQEYDEVIIGLHGHQKRKGVNYGISQSALSLMNQLAKQTKVHAVVMANPYAIRKLTEEQYAHLASLTFAYGNEIEIQKLAAQALFGGIDVCGVLPLSLNDYLVEGMGYTVKATRLSYTDVPEEVGMDSEKLKGIKTIVDEMIAEKMAPGCQILVARKGKVAYDKSFGYHTYSKQRKVKNSDVYDIASVTKVAATVPLVMQLCDEGVLNLNSSIDHYLPELVGTDKADLTLKELLLHQSGLKSHIGFDFNMIDEEKLEDRLFSNRRSSIYNIQLTPSIYMTRNYVMKEGYISKVKDEHFSVEVAKGIYTFEAYRDEMYSLIDTLDLCEDKKYRYSDLGFYYAMRIVEKVTGKRLDELAEERIYSPMGMSRMSYNPLKTLWKEDVVPTVNETFFRNQLLHGYVHDQGAALLGGVAGHAGLFSNANDLAKLMQMYLNDGFYGGDSYMKPETVGYFTQHTENTYRRGVGFDKSETNADRPQPTCLAASPRTFGHTGFTGIGVWADPEHDLIYIFLSNRVNPDSYNTKLFNEDIRPRIQQVIYDSILF